MQGSKIIGALLFLARQWLAMVKPGCIRLFYKRFAILGTQNPVQAQITMNYH